MTPFELNNAIHKEVGEYLPRLSAVVNKALLYHGDGLIVTAESGTDALQLTESEAVAVKPDEAPEIMLRVMNAAHLLESHSRWRLICDTKPAMRGGRMELRYTLLRGGPED